ncbi:hypothetical protein QL285_024184 [Trifolium repens]|jgi:hypothetical protein|nr:hypothetical protein QL285_024184 [Trifolium repens]
MENLCFLKVNSPSSLGDYKRISLLGCLLKLIAKVLTDRLAKVMNMVITVSQSIFIKERNIIGGVMVANEMVDLTKKNKNCLMLKVNLGKSYASTLS